ncbi:MAG TPA: UDP-2,4-diacetamido-2,4,6-trideoxy-beta-L-altropyranose hydrolase [Caulobacteraceae bacterium]|nr:UDP-2,4-diacetamido-2,4,6-trideoxy-beta-L-altropyranose hydrolase [Caulobacteraceae bacterium]
MTPPRVLVFPDGGPRIGGGHVMRCLTLAEALSDQGAQVAFAANAAAGAVIAAYGPVGVEVFPLPDDLDAAVAVVSQAPADWVLLDHYRLTLSQEATLKGKRRLAVLDDLADRPRAADLWLDPGYGRTAADYASLARPGASVLAGPAYAPVRPAFAALRAQALARRALDTPPARALVFLGLGDLDAITARVLRALRPALPTLTFDVVLGKGAASLPALWDAPDPRVRLHVDTPAMAELCAQADLAIGAGGSATWERAVLGLPSVTVILADNQRAMAQAMARDGLTLALDSSAPDFDARLAAAARQLLDDAALRQALSARISALCDGRGAARFAEVLLREAGS